MRVSFPPPLGSKNQQFLDTPRSQSINRIHLGLDRCLCVTPGARLWLRGRGRLMFPEEKWLLQGMPLEKHLENFVNSPMSVLHKLAGNAFNGFNLSTGFLCALACCPMKKG